MNLRFPMLCAGVRKLALALVLGLALTPIEAYAAAPVVTAHLRTQLVVAGIRWFFKSSWSKLRGRRSSGFIMEVSSLVRCLGR